MYVCLGHKGSIYPSIIDYIHALAMYHFFIDVDMHWLYNSGNSALPMKSDAESKNQKTHLNMTLGKSCMAMYSPWFNASFFTHFKITFGTLSKQKKSTRTCNQSSNIHHCPWFSSFIFRPFRS